MQLRNYTIYTFKIGTTGHQYNKNTAQKQK